MQNLFEHSAALTFRERRVFVSQCLVHDPVQILASVYDSGLVKVEYTDEAVLNGSSGILEDKEVVVCGLPSLLG